MAGSSSCLQEAHTFSLPLSCVISGVIIGRKRVTASSSSQSVPIGSQRVFQSQGSPPLERPSLRPPRGAGDIPHIPGLATWVAAGPQAVGTRGTLADPLVSWEPSPPSLTGPARSDYSV